MGVFKNWARTAQAKVSKFANNTLPGAISKGASFFTNRVVPAIRLGHRVLKAAANEIHQSDIIEPKHKSKVSKVSEFSDLGLKRLEEANVSVDNFSKKYGRVRANQGDLPLAPA
jgi:hypothetical protein